MKKRDLASLIDRDRAGGAAYVGRARRSDIGAWTLLVYREDNGVGFELETYRDNAPKLYRSLDTLAAEAREIGCSSLTVELSP